ncbi:zinc finger protein 120-like isoform X8 [Arvicola amphibius]|uniref:zinc finger protein 120-like isoform X8 n=1 Tax=Arvicola amphibius TaxID=1047088 RepID=UPI0018E3A6AC|nr:zinc finger protein 120-like isoform X8 [Arvicola amphibius]
MNTVTYDDLHIDFTWKEWALLNPSQKNLYKDVMLETYRNLATIGLSSWKQTRGIPQQLPVACKIAYASKKKGPDPFKLEGYKVARFPVGAAN